MASKQNSNLPTKPDVLVFPGKNQFSPPFKLGPLQFTDDEDEDGKAPVTGIVLEDSNGVAVAYFNQTNQTIADIEAYASSWFEGYLQARMHLGVST